MALDRIVAHKRAEIADRMRELPLALLEATVGPSDRSFAGAVRARRPAFILEVKPRSPSEGRLRDPPKNVSSASTEIASARRA
jgi:indole-3-glycerol phosphate synthase / phosphoribosylanthranilate isomerase